MGEKRCYEDLEIGAVFELGEVSVSEADIIAFAREYDAQPFHLDHAAAERSPLRALAASGWHTCSLGNRLFIESFAEKIVSRGGAGVDDCRWRKPLYGAERAGPMSGRVRIKDKRLLESLPDRGLLTLEVELTQRDPFGPEGAPPRPLCVMVFQTMTARREPGAPAAPRAESERAKAASATVAFEAVSPIEGFTETRASEIALHRRVLLGEWDFTAEDIISFAKRFDPQDFHLSEAGGRAGPFGGLAASGWHTTAIFMKLFIKARTEALAAMSDERRRQAIAAFGPSPGFSNLRWRRPVMADDRLRYFVQTIKVEPWRGSSDWSLMTGLTEAVNQKDQLVMSFESSGLVRP